MKNTLLLMALALMIGLSGCHNNQPDYCTVKGTIKGVKNGTILELEDEFNFQKTFDATRVKDGTFEFHPNITTPTHVYLYSENGQQLKDFFLEPGTVIVTVDADDEEDYTVDNTTGTISNETLQKIYELGKSGNQAEADALWQEVISAEQTGVLALYYAADLSKSAILSLDILNRLSPDLAAKPSIPNLREKLTQRCKTEPAPEGSEPNYFIDMTYPDADGNPISLSSVVSNPDNRYVVLDFWATWCGACIEEIPMLREVYAKYHEKGVEIYSVAENSDVEYWKNFIEENGMTWINVCDDEPGNGSKSWNNYALHGIPTLLVIEGQTGIIVARDRNLEKTLSTLLP